VLACFAEWLALEIGWRARVNAGPQFSLAVDGSGASPEVTLWDWCPWAHQLVVGGRSQGHNTNVHSAQVVSNQKHRSWDYHQQQWEDGNSVARGLFRLVGSEALGRIVPDPTLHGGCGPAAAGGTRAGPKRQANVLHSK
jgi:hypothetical protein